MPTYSSLRSALKLLLPLTLLAGCAHGSLQSGQAPAPQIPPLPAQAKQSDSPTFSAAAQTDIEAWLKLLTEQSSPVSPAKPATAH